MTKTILLPMLFLLIISCQSNTKKIDSADEMKITTSDTIIKKNEVEEFNNKIFKEVTVSKISDTTFEIKGKARVFEATIGWDIEDGHYVLKEGFTNANIGAPSWGSFTFQVSATKVDKNSTLLLVLFEESAEDGSRQNELPIKLY